jgi:hypothetical protein
MQLSRVLALSVLVLLYYQQITEYASSRYPGKTSNAGYCQQKCFQA